jgi:hypothetical protein
MARPRKDLTKEQIAQVEALAAFLTQEQIADYFGIGDRTLRRKFSEEPEVLAAYARGRAVAFREVAGNLVNQAREGNVRAAEFYLKTQAGWKETQSHEISGPGGSAMAHEIVIRHEVVDADEPDGSA